MNTGTDIRQMVVVRLGHVVEGTESARLLAELVSALLDSGNSDYALHPTALINERLAVQQMTVRGRRFSIMVGQDYSHETSAMVVPFPSSEERARRRTIHLAHSNGQFRVVFDGHDVREVWQRMGDYEESVDRNSELGVTVINKARLSL